MLAIVAFLSLGLLTACGGGGGAGRTIEIIAGEGSAMKYDQSTLTAKKGEKITIHLVNKDGTQAHSILIPDFNVNSGQVAANKDKSITFTASKTGEFDFHCDVPGHKEGGMFGKLTVTE